MTYLFSETEVDFMLAEVQLGFDEQMNHRGNNVSFLILEFQYKILSLN